MVVVAHKEHGRGSQENGPDDPDCPCRGTDEQESCAHEGCGFCRAAEGIALWNELTGDGYYGKGERMGPEDAMADIEDVLARLKQGELTETAALAEIDEIILVSGCSVAMDEEG